jgi:hypothetical protein
MFQSSMRKTAYHWTCDLSWESVKEALIVFALGAGALFERDGGQA